VSREPWPYRPHRCSECGTATRVINGMWLRWLRERARPKVSLRAFARSLKFSAAYISDIERNRRGCAWEIQQAYERLKGVKP
jgi:hypothetical protein